MKALRIILLALAFIAFQAHAKDDGRNLVVKQNSSAGKRIALVIGNGNYQHPDSLPKLANPTHDAEDIAKALRGFGFEVIEKKDQSLEGMSDAITEFSRKIGDSEAALFYFAGHGLQVKGQNYLVPVDARIETEAQVSFKSINVNLILEEMDSGKNRANIVILDACRNNPISGKFRSGATRGLAAVTSQPKGTVIVYATDPGNVAADGNGRNGLFTAGLLTAFKGSDLSLGGVLTRASEEVERGSEKKQTPYVNGPMTLQKSFQFGQGTQIAGLESVSTFEDSETVLWVEAQKGNSKDDYNAYLTQYPKGKYATLAKSRVNKIQDEAAAEASRVASEASHKEQLNEKRISMATAILHNLIKSNSQTLALSIQGTTHPTGNSASLAGYNILPQNDHILVQLNVDWHGGLLQGSRYRTTVSWKLTPEEHLIAEVTGDTAAFAVAGPNKQVLDQYFRNSIYPIFYSSMQRVSYMWKPR